MIVVVLLVGALATSFSGADPDLWGHVQYGRDVLIDGLPTTGTYNYTAVGYRWINHENLSELALAIGTDTLGPASLLVLKALLGVAICCLPFLVVKPKSENLFPLSVLSLIIALNLTNHWSLRPQLFSFGFFALLIGLLHYAFAGWQGRWNLPWCRSTFRAEAAEPLSWSHKRVRWLWLMVPLICVWTNSHGGFAAGLAVLIAYLVCRMLEAAASCGWQSVGMQKRLCLMIFGALIATLLNPYSVELHRWMLSALGEPRPEITEWHPLYTLDLFSLAFFALTTVIVVGTLFSRKSLDFTHLVVLILVMAQAAMHQRHTPFLAILAAFWITPHWVATWQSWSSASQPQTQSNLMQWAKLAGVAMLIVVLLIPLGSRLSQMKVRRDRYPVSAIEFLDQHHLHGRTIVSFNWAQYFIAARCRDGDSRVQFDGRFRTCYPQKVIDRHFDFLLGNQASVRYRGSGIPFTPEAILEEGKPRLALIDRGQPHSVDVMQNQDAWSLLYQDRLAQLWGRKSIFDDPKSPHYLPLHVRQITNDPQIGFVAWPAIPQSTSHETLPEVARHVATP